MPAACWRHIVCSSFGKARQSGPAKSLIEEEAMSLANLEDVFQHELKDVLDAERQILKALPKMVKAAESEELKAALEEHRGVTEERALQ